MCAGARLSAVLQRHCQGARSYRRDAPNLHLKEGETSSLQSCCIRLHQDFQRPTVPLVVHNRLAQGDERVCRQGVELFFWSPDGWRHILGHACTASHQSCPACCCVRLKGHSAFTRPYNGTHLWLPGEAPQSSTSLRLQAELVERFVVVHGQIILNQFKNFPKKSVANSAFVSGLKAKMELRRHCKLYAMPRPKARVRVRVPPCPPPSPHILYGARN